ncbi:MAG: hypothetical protein SP4CHLAM5_09280 [Chlamydiia bacterium]|nr:hypothetical protein [Chlamydiia bacterium]MCH9618787.1 hypothetical protein [Chlamydiia bacterium]MCH9624620.1 hypothetical protein [Chlamydiia bacterium]
MFELLLAENSGKYMKKLMLIATCLFTITFCFASEKIVYIDINNTTIATDRMFQKGPIETLQVDIAKKVYVYEKDGAAFPTNREGANKITYFQWFRLAYPDIKVRQKAFLSTLENLKNMNHPQYEVMKNSYDTSFQILDTQYKENNLEIFPSIIKLIQWANSEKIKKEHNIHLVFRTFGIEGKNVMDQINEFFNKELVSQIYHINENGTLQESELDVTAFTLAMNKRILVVRDNFERWRKGKKLSCFGKPCPMKDGVEITFFDDNAHEKPLHPKKGIIDVRDPNGNPMSTKDAIAAHIVIPITLEEVIQDIDFFINHI